MKYDSRLDLEQEFSHSGLVGDVSLEIGCTLVLVDSGIPGNDGNMSTFGI